MSSHLHSQIEELRKNLKILAADPASEDAQAILQATLQLAENMEATLDSEYEALHEAMDLAQQAKNKFVSVVTHELRIPLTSIKGYADLLLQQIVGPVNEQQLNFLTTIRNNVERMSALISDLSDISHLETGRMKFAIQPVPVRQAVEGVLNPFLTKIAEKGQSLEVTLPDELPHVIADPNRLAQILTCLVKNAWQYTPSGGFISLLVTQDQTLIRFEVTDTGIGIKDEDQPKVFSQFFRSDLETVREQPGWGLALHLSKRLAEAMGGQLEYKSQSGEGSTFWLLLPARQLPG